MRQLTSAHKPPSAPPPSAASPLTPGASGRINADTRQASSWQRLGFRSKLFLSQTVKLVKIFHVLLKPLTIPSFVPLDVHGTSPAPPRPPPLPTLRHPTPPCLCQPLAAALCPMSLKGTDSRCSNFTCWQLSLSLFNPVWPSCHPYSLHLHRVFHHHHPSPTEKKKERKENQPKKQLNCCSSFFMAALKGPIFRRRTETRSGVLADFHPPLICE